VFDRRWANASDDELERMEYVIRPDFDPVTRWAFKFRDSASYDGVTYGKSASLLATLGNMIGHDTMDEAMRTYFMKFRFTHPTTEDFLRTIEAVAVARGRATVITPDPSWPTGFADVPPVNSSLRPYFNQAVYGTQVLDYTVDSVSSDPVEWWMPEPKDEKARKRTAYKSTVYLHRKGDFILPVTVDVVFDDGTRQRERWDGVDRWQKLTFVRNARVISAEIDPDHAVLLDTDLFNNSIRTQPDDVPARKLNTIWSSAMQLFGQVAAWIV
jgi:hypothetical protein